MADESGESGYGGDTWLEQTQYFARRVYEDPLIGPVPLDLYAACAIGNYECVQEAVNKGVNLNVNNKGGWTPLMYASYVGHDTVVNLLLDGKADPNKGTPEGLTPLMVAAGCGNESVCFFLMQSGARINDQDDRGYTALYNATRQGHQNTVQLLLEHGAEIELCDKQNGYTPLMIAAMEGDQIVLDILIACQADINAKSNDGNTARTLALKNNHIKTVSYLDEVTMLYMYYRSPSAESDVTIDVSSSLDHLNDDLHAGPEEVEEWTQKRMIQMKLGRRAGPRWSLPPEYIGSGSKLRRSSSISETAVTRRLKFRPAMSLPESQFPPRFDEECEESPEDSMGKLQEFLFHLGLQKYYEVFEQHEIGFRAMLDLTDTDLRKLFDKVGPRKKLLAAIQEYREMEDDGNDVTGSTSTLVGKKTPEVSENFDKGGSSLSHAKQVAELKEIQKELEERLHICEKELARENELKKMAEGLLLQLQQSKAKTVKITSDLKDTLLNVLKHTNSFRKTHSSMVEQLSSQTSIPRDQLKVFLSQLGGELEAVTRSAQQALQDSKAVHHQLSSLS